MYDEKTNVNIKSINRNDPNENLCLSVIGDEYGSGKYMTRAECGTTKSQNWRVVHETQEIDKTKVEKILIKDPSL